MKRWISLLLAAALELSLAGCSGGVSGTAAPDETELHVFAAASLKEPLTQIGGMFEKKFPQVTIVYTFDSSGTLQDQIEAGAECDVFLSAAQRQMDALSDEAYLDEETRVDLLENQVVLAVPEGNPAGVTSFANAAADQVDLIALGNSDVPAGQYAKELFTSLGIWTDIQDKATFGSNVKEVAAWVKEGAADCGVIYATDAYSSGLEVADTADPSLLTSQVLYPAAVLKEAEAKEMAGTFLHCLQTEEYRAVFAAAGFTFPS